MLYRLCIDSFTRNIDGYGYIKSQLTYQDRVYDRSGAIFLMALDRTPQHFDDLLRRISASFIDANLNQIRDDLHEFLNDLVNSNFIVAGSSEKELQSMEPRFSYSLTNPKTSTYNFRQESASDVDTTDLFQSIFNRRPRVTLAQIELTNRCNERCIHCYIPHEQKTETLATRLAEKVLGELAEMGTLGVTFSGGEPFMHKDIEHILALARKLDFCITILSNLTLTTPRHISLLREINPSMIQTSLYSMNPDEHDHITKKAGSHARTLSALKSLIAAEIPVQISCPVMRTNTHSYRSVLEWAREHNCKAQTDYIMMARSDFSHDNLGERIALEEQAILLGDILETDLEYNQLLDVPCRPKTPEELEVESICGVARDSICLSASGVYYPCSGWQGLPVGNCQTQSVRDVWENSHQLLQLRKITKGSFQRCISCEHKEFCAMCMVRNFNESGGDVFMINPHVCRSAELNHFFVEEHLSRHRKKVDH